MNPLLPLLGLFFGCADVTSPDPAIVEAPAAVTPTPAPDADPLLRRAAQADAVFAGTVVAIEHAMSVPDELGRDFPVTYLHFAVDRGLKGVRDGDTHVVRMFGGPWGDGRVMILAHQPIFQVGDTDLVFVRGNGRTGAPFVDGPDGRVRLLDDRAWTDQGTALSGPDAMPAADLLDGLETRLVDARLDGVPDAPSADPAAPVLETLPL